MRTHSTAMTITLAWGILATACGTLNAGVFVDSGFEDYAVAGGGFVQPTSGPWTFNNDAGVVEPFSPNSSTEPLHTWSATFPAWAGQQYASTYAGSDYLRQVVSLDAGKYAISVHAAAPSGSVTIPQVATLQLGDGEFTFTLGNASIGAAHTVAEGSNWTLYSAVFAVDAPGSYELGVRNAKSAPYFINYDGFAIAAVPEPSTLVLAVLGLLGVVVAWWRRKAA
ncbi:MAG: PEP-CTERM sorting domain-containing protein [Pirellulales bacterium]